MLNLYALDFSRLEADPIKVTAQESQDLIDLKEMILSEWAAKGIAPELLYCGSVDLSDDAPSYEPLKMIVMEYLDGKTAAQLEDNLPKDFAAQLTEIVSVLYNGGFVFGDLRRPSIMVVKQIVKLIDWAGKMLNTQFTWPTTLAGQQVLLQWARSRSLTTSTCYGSTERTSSTN
ncbi:hypothetical protein C8J57DRAFT_1521013 [Mycena rebaudengoi]|nr:hypothetical protein C8J57DRAFT_1521013 [Mycena rebaudengoi]